MVTAPHNNFTTIQSLYIASRQLETFKRYYSFDEAQIARLSSVVVDLRSKMTPAEINEYETLTNPALSAKDKKAQEEEDLRRMEMNKDREGI